MSLRAASYIDLEKNFPSFLFTFDKSMKPMDEVQKKAVELFSETVKKFPLDAIQKCWTKIERTLGQEGQSLDPKLSARVLKLHEKIRGLTPPAVLVEDLLEEPDIQKALKDQIPASESPKTLEQAKIMFCRIKAGVYGNDWPKRLNSPVMAPTMYSLIRMLYIDSLFRAIDPCDTIEWFSKCNRQENEVLRHALRDLVVKLRVECKPEVEIRATLLSPRPGLSNEMQERYNTFLNSVNVSPIAMLAIWEFIQPSDKILKKCALQVAKQDPERAFQISLRINHVSTILPAIASHHEKLAFEMLDRLRGLNPERYGVDLRFFAETTIYPALIPAILTHINDLRMRLELFEICLLKQFSRDKPEEFLQRIMTILESYKDSDDYQMLLLSVVFVTLAKSLDPKLATHITPFTDPALKLHLCHRLILRFTNTFGSEEAVKALSSVEPYFTTAEEKLVLLQAKVRLAAKYNHKTALKLAKTTPVEAAQISLERLTSRANNATTFAGIHLFSGETNLAVVLHDILHAHRQRNFSALGIWPQLQSHTVDLTQSPDLAYEDIYGAT